MIPPLAVPPHVEVVIGDIWIRMIHYDVGSGRLIRGVAISVKDANVARSPQQVRMIAAALVQAADEFDRWERSFT